MPYYTQGIGSGQAAGHKHLSSVRNEPLHEAGEGIKYAGSLARVQTETPCYVVCNATCRYDCNRIVCRA